MCFIGCRRNLKRFVKYIHFESILIIGQINMFSEHPDVFDEGTLSNLIFYPAEGEAADTQYEVMYPRNFNYNLLSSIVFWGAKPKEWFEKNRIMNIEKLVIGGYSRGQIAQLYKDNNKREKKIGFIGRFGLLNDLYGRGPIEHYFNEMMWTGGDLNDNIKFLEANTNAEAAALSGYIKLISYLINKSDYKISIRPHPNENHESYSKLITYFGGKLEVDMSTDAADWTSTCEKVVGMGSSIYIDCFFTKTPVISVDEFLNLKTFTLQYNPTLHYVHDGAYLPKSLESACELIVTKDLAPVYNERFEKFIENNYFPTNIKPINILTNAINELSTKAKILDAALLIGLLVVDELLALKNLLRNRERLMFDYSWMHSHISRSLKDIAKVYHLSLNTKASK